jgi:hypothetical protein
VATHPPPCPLPTPLGGQNIYGGKQGMPIPSVVAREGRAGRSPFCLPLVASGHYEQVGRRPRVRPARYRISIHARSKGGGYLSAQQPERTVRTQMSNHETIQHSYTQTCIRSLSHAATHQRVRIITARRSTGSSKPRIVTVAGPQPKHIVMHPPAAILGGGY